MSLGPLEIVVILLVALVVFGPQRLPEVGRQVGSLMRELRRMQDSVRSEIDQVINPDPDPNPHNAAAEDRDHSTPIDAGSGTTDDGFASPGEFS